VTWGLTVLSETTVAAGEVKAVRLCITVDI
jgi:hypothetical protein